VGLPVAAGPLRAGVISVVPLLTFLVAFVPWNVFAFRYAGRGNLLTRPRVLTVGVLVAVLLVVYVSVAAGVLQPSQESYSSVLLAASTLLLGLVAVTFVSSGLVLTAAYRHGTVPVASGVAVVFPVAILVVGIQVVSLSGALTRELLASLHLLAAAAALPVAVARYDVLTTRPGTPRLGERTVIEDLNEAVLVLDTEGSIVRSNRQAERLFGADLDGQDIDGVVGTDVGTLRDVSTMECWTDQGYKRLDPRVSTVRTGHDRTVGETVTLIDVTGPEMLRQRVQVLNRIFRHNIRNDLDVIRAHAEFALRHGNETPEPTEADESVEQILDVTDQVIQLSDDARRIERLTRNASADQSVVNVSRLVTEVVETVTRDRPDVSTTVQVPAVELSINRELFRFALRNLVDNAVEHNDSPSPSVEVRGTERESGVRILVSDNGPGIPDAEWQVIEAGRERVHDHATSLGLWATKWTVQKMGGELSRRDTENGATVVIDLPE
jgi:signal transduction histidine kinase